VGLHELRESAFDDFNTPYVENFLRQTLVRGVGALATLAAIENERHPPGRGCGSFSVLSSPLSPIQPHVYLAFGSKAARFTRLENPGKSRVHFLPKTKGSGGCSFRLRNL
jgi:hypothetical protein